MLSLKIIYKLDFQLIIAIIGYMGKDLNLRLIIRGSQDHALVGPQPKGSTQRVYEIKFHEPFSFPITTIEFETNLSHFTHQLVGGLNTH